ncbi:MAG: HD domain-containing protein [Bacteroidia bacterium]|nr:HD domain-containing protein [Bacteroidia bacterium]
MNPTLQLPIFTELQQCADKLGLEAYVIGGYVRDLVLKRNSKDIDVVVVGDALPLAKAFANLHKQSDFAVFKNFGTAMVKTADWEVEFVGSRKESYRTDSRKPTVSPGTLTDDQNRRDFTINALAISINKNTFGQFVDPFGGLDDISNQLIKTPLAPDITFSDDPLRMLRAIRFASQLGFTILPETFEAIQRNAERIKIISYERISEELNKILLSPKPSVGLKLLFESGLLKLVFKELQKMHGVEVKNGKAHKDNFYHTIHVVDNICEETNNLWLRWAALLHDIGKPATKRFIEAEGGWKFHGHEDKGSRMVPNIFNNLKLPQNEKMRYVQKLVALHHRPKALAEDGVTDSAIRRLIVDAGDDLEDLFTLCRADMTTRFAEKIALYKSNLNKVQQLVKEVEERDELRNWQPPITGEMIMETFKLQPCKEVGLIKNQIREAILDGKIKNDYNEAFAYMKTIATELGVG